jgi:hypothetical protein
VKRFQERKALKAKTLQRAQKAQKKKAVEERQRRLNKKI